MNNREKLALRLAARLVEWVEKTERESDHLPEDLVALSQALGRALKPVVNYVVKVSCASSGMDYYRIAVLELTDRETTHAIRDMPGCRIVQLWDEVYYGGRDRPYKYYDAAKSAAEALAKQLNEAQGNVT